MSILSLFLFASMANSEVSIDRIVAVVNNEPILSSDVQDLLKKADQSSLIEDILLQGSPASDLKKDEKVRLDYLIAEKILDSHVKRLGMTAGPERIESEIKQMAQRYKMAPEDILSAARADMGLGPSEYRSFLKKQIERQSLIESEISSKVRVSDEEVYAEFRKSNPRSKSSLGEVTLAHIFFNPKKGGVTKARERAEAVLKKLVDGGDFASLAEQNSEDSQFAAGGALGTFSPGDLIPEFESALIGLNKGQFAKEVVESKRGLHILRLVDQRAAKNEAFEKEKEKIRSVLMERAFSKQFSLWLKRAREEASITRFEKK
ncbi:MAG: peptidylprolyl isomerase [Bdellovibrionales bacterium]